MTRRVARTRAGGRWTEARYFAFIRSALRHASMRYPVKQDVLKASRRPKPSRKAGRHRYEYKCASCRKWHQGKDVAVDHIVPAGTLKTYDDLPGFVERLFCEADGLQIQCKACHKTKTKDDNARTKKR